MIAVHKYNMHVKDYQGSSVLYDPTSASVQLLPLYLGHVTSAVDTRRL